MQAGGAGVVDGVVLPPPRSIIPGAPEVRSLQVAPAMLTVKKVAAQLGVCTATVYKLCNSGELSHSRVLNAIRVAPADLEAFLERRKLGLVSRRPK